MNIIGKTISHYKILKKIGEGGMGMVYKAEDTKLKRTVALKFLPPELTRNKEAKERFVHEAQAASALEHNNICNIHEIDEADDGQTFIVMACYEGETLKHKIKRGPFKLEESIDIAIQIAEGLAKAHEQGIVHRDIKSANLYVTTDDVVKILDFGLAKLRGQTKLTKEGTTLGTAAYMSPEQTRGEDIDHRTDIWSLGIVLYEMFTGQLPFKGEYEQAIIYSILNEDPEPITGLRTGMPMELERIVNKALAKSPGERYQHIDDLVADLRRVKREIESKEIVSRMGIPRVGEVKKGKRFLIPIALTLVTIVSIVAYLIFTQQPESLERIPIAVVDFLNETDDKELDGLSGLLITALEQSRRLEVLTRSRMFDFLRQLNMYNVERIDEGAGRAICKAANISVLAIGTVKKFGELYTVDLKVIDVQNDKHLFAAKADGKGKEAIPFLIDVIAERTRVKLKEPLKKIQASKQKVSDMTTINLEAYHHYFKGEEAINKLRFREAQEEFEKAIVLDSTFGLAYYRIAYAESWGLESERIQKNHLEKALAFINRIPEKEQFLVRAQYASIDRGYEEGISILKEMEKIYPNDKEMIYNIGDWSYIAGQYDTAVEYFERVLNIDPMFERARFNLASAYFALREFQKTLREGERMLFLNPFDVDAHILIGYSYIFLGEVEKGVAKFDSAFDLTSAPEKVQDVYYHRAGSKLYLGKYRESRDDYKKILEIAKHSQPEPHRPHYLIHLALAHIEDISQNYEAALQQFGEALSLSPTVLRIYRDLGATYARKGDIKEAESVADTILVRLGGKPNRYFHHVAGEIAVAKKDYIGAVQHFEKSCSENQIFIYCYPLARAHALAENIGVAIDVLERGVSRGTVELFYKSRVSPEVTGKWDFYFTLYYPHALFFLGTLYEQTGETTKAIQTYEGFLNLWKEADEDLPVLIDAKDRLAKLKEMAMK